MDESASISLGYKADNFEFPPIFLANELDLTELWESLSLGSTDVHPFEDPLSELEACVDAFISVKHSSDPMERAHCLHATASIIRAAPMTQALWDWLLRSKLLDWFAKESFAAPLKSPARSQLRRGFLRILKAAQTASAETKLQLSRTQIYALAYESALDEYDCSRDKSVREFCSLFCIVYPHFAAVLRYLCCLRGSGLINDSLFSLLSSVFKNHMLSKDMNINGRFYQPHIWFYITFLDDMLNREHDLDSICCKRMEALSCAITLALLGLGHTFITGKCLFLERFPPAWIGFWFGKSLKDTAGTDYQLERLNRLLEFLDVWSLVAHENLREVFEVLAPFIVELIEDDDEPFVRAAGLRFFVFFIDQRVYRNDDAVNMDFLFELDDCQQEGLRELIDTLIRYFDSLTG
jgi:hypothetical protein